MVALVIGIEQKLLPKFGSNGFNGIVKNKALIYSSSVQLRIEAALKKVKNIDNEGIE